MRTYITGLPLTELDMQTMNNIASTVVDILDVDSDEVDLTVPHDTARGFLPYVALFASALVSSDNLVVVTYSEDHFEEDPYITALSILALEAGCDFYVVDFNGHVVYSGGMCEDCRAALDDELEAVGEEVTYEQLLDESSYGLADFGSLADELDAYLRKTTQKTAENVTDASESDEQPQEVDVVAETIKLAKDAVKAFLDGFNESSVDEK